MVCNIITPNSFFNFPRFFRVTFSRYNLNRLYNSHSCVAQKYHILISSLRPFLPLFDYLCNHSTFPSSDTKNFTRHDTF